MNNAVGPWTLVLIGFSDEAHAVPLEHTLRNIELRMVCEVSALFRKMLSVERLTHGSTTRRVEVDIWLRG